MIARIFGPHAFGACLALAACSAEGTHEGPDAHHGTDTTPPKGGSKAVAAMEVGASFGWDATTGTTVDVTLDGAIYPPTLWFTLHTAAWTGDPGQVEEHCTITFDLTGLPAAGWAGEHGRWLGLDRLKSAGDGDCAHLDTSWLGGDAVGALSDLDFGVAIGGELEPEVAAAVIDGFGAEYLDVIVGASLLTDLLPSEATHDGYAFGYEVDPSFAVTSDDGMLVPIPFDSMPHASAGVRTGYYETILGTLGFQQP